MIRLITAASVAARTPNRQATRPPIESPKTGPYMERKELFALMDAATSARAAGVS